MDLTKESNSIDRFLALTGDLLRDETVKSMKQYHHHKSITTHFHSLYVAYTVFKMCETLNHKDERAIVRAALLHDYYLYEWYTEKHEEYHIWYHPKQAVKNIEGHFGHLSDMQRNMILSHMFPTCVELPKSSGAWILTAADKRCAVADYMKVSKSFLPVYNEINRRVEAL